MIYGSLAHSEIKLKSKLWDIIWITPAAHRVHHSTRVEHFDSNFGILTLWDYLFGTYHPPVAEKLTYGVEDGDTFNRSRYFAEVFDTARRWLNQLVATNPKLPPQLADDASHSVSTMSEPKKAA